MSKQNIKLLLSNSMFGAALFFGLLVPNSAEADYLATGKFWGLECKYLIACKRVYVHAIDAGNGLNSIKTEYPNGSIDEFNSELGICHIRVEKGIFGGLLNIFSTRGFYTKLDDGTHRPVSIDTLSFDCTQIR